MKIEYCKTILNGLLDTIDANIEKLELIGYYQYAAFCQGIPCYIYFCKDNKPNVLPVKFGLFHGSTHTIFDDEDAKYLDLHPKYMDLVRKFQDKFPYERIEKDLEFLNITKKFNQIPVDLFVVKQNTSILEQITGEYKGKYSLCDLLKNDKISHNEAKRNDILALNIEYNHLVEVAYDWTVNGWANSIAIPSLPMLATSLFHEANTQSACGADKSIIVRLETVAFKLLNIDGHFDDSSMIDELLADVKKLYPHKTDEDFKQIRKSMEEEQYNVRRTQ